MCLENYLISVLSLFASASLAVADDENNLNPLPSPLLADVANPAKIIELRGKRMKRIDWKDVDPATAFQDFFHRVETEFNLRFGASIEEQSNPIPFWQRRLNHSNLIKLDFEEADAFDLFNGLIAMSKWHWRVGANGHIVIYAWHLPETDGRVEQNRVEQENTSSQNNTAPKCGKSSPTGNGDYSNSVNSAQYHPPEGQPLAKPNSTPK